MRDTRLSCKYKSGGDAEFDSETIFDIIQNEIDCRQLRTLIFGSNMDELSDVEHLMDRRQEMFSAIGNIFWIGSILVYFVHYSKMDFSLSGDGGIDRTYSERLNQIFGTVYNGENMSLDKALAIFTEMQVHVHLDSRSPYAGMIIDHDDCGEYKLAEICTYVKVWETDAALIDGLQYKDIQQLLIDTVYTFPFLGGLKISLDGARANFVLDREHIDTLSCLWKLNNRYYYLYDAHKKKDGSYRCLIRCFKNYRFYHLNGADHKSDIDAIGIDEELAASVVDSIAASYPKIKSHFGDAIRNCQFLKINFGYIYKLAISLCDIMDAAGKDYFKTMFEAGSRELFEQAYDPKTDSYNWEQLITMVLIDCGPSAVLDCIINNNNFKSLLENLSVRLPYSIDVTGSVARLQEIQKKELAFLNKLLPAGNANSSGYRENVEKVLCIARTRLLIDILSRRGEPEEDNIEKISVREKFFDMYSESHSVSESDKIKHTYQAFNSIFYTINCFYVGCIEYSHERNITERKNAFDRLEVNKRKDKGQYSGYDTAESIDERYKSYQESFMRAARQIAPYIYEQPLETKVEIFKYICSHFIYSSAAAQTDVTIKEVNGETSFSNALKKVLGQKVGDDGETDTVRKNRDLLQRLIGRKVICRAKALDKILDLGDGVSFFNYDQKTAGTRTGSFFASPFYKAAKNLFAFLNYNSGYMDEKDEKLLIDNHDPIFPYVVKCKVKNAHSDGYRFGNYSLMLGGDGDAATRKLLSENEFEMSKTYYCIPNALMSNHLCWIEPFMIDAREFTRRISIDNISIKAETEG